MDSESSDESQEEIDLIGDGEQDAEEDNLEEDAEEDQANSQSLDGDDDQERPTKAAPTSDPRNARAQPIVRPEALKASVYDIVPTIAAPHSTSINAVISTPDLRWVFSGGSDGYIRKFNWIETANGKSMLTVAQRHPFVDSVTKAGVLASYWENSDASSGKSSDDNASISAVYSLAVHHEALWLLSGLESGGINLQSVRHDEGKRITCLRGHTSAVSVLTLASDEKSFLSGSWDKTVLDWDLNTGKTIRNFEGSAGQISALEARPISSLKVPEYLGDTQEIQRGNSSDNADKPRMNGILTNGIGYDEATEAPDTDLAINGTAVSPADSLFGGNDADSLFGDNENIGVPSGAFDDDDDNDFSKAIASGLQEQEHVQEQPQDGDIGEADGDTTMDDTVGVPSIPITNGDTSGASPPFTDAPEPPSQLTRLESLGELSAYPQSEDLAPPSQQILEPDPPEPASNSDSTFLAASFDGSLRIWDRRQPSAVARMTPHHVPPWCMNACWSPDGNFIYAGRRNGTVDEYSLHKGLQRPTRNFKLPNNSGAVSAVRAMPNGRHLICASYDILRLYDLQEQQIFKHATAPFLIVPGHRTSVVSQLYIDPSCQYLLSAAGNRGWEGSTSEVLLGYEVGVPS